MSEMKMDGLQPFHYSGGRQLGAFSLCAFFILIQQSGALSIPQPSPTAPATSPVSSLAMISSQQPNNGTSSSSVLVVGRETTGLTPGQMVINAVPVEDRSCFLEYQLAVGLHGTRAIGNQTQWLRTLEDLIGHFEERGPQLKQNVPVYGNFATDLLQWLMEKFHLSPEDVYNQLRSRSTLMCTSDGVCYSRNDLVCFCCPF